MNKERKIFLVKSFIFLLILSISFLYIRVIKKDYDELIESYVLVSTLLTSIFLLTNKKIIYYFSSFGFIISYLISNKYFYNNTTYVLIYICIIITGMIIEKMFHVKHRR